MPNWCEGSMKLRGKALDILRFIQEGLNVYENDTPIEKDKWLEIKDNNNEVEIYFIKDTIYVEGTARAFINNRYSSNLHYEEYFVLHKDDDDEVLCFTISQAWGFRKDDWVTIAEKYGLDIWLYGVDQGNGYVENWRIDRHGEMFFLDMSPIYENYKDFLWRCPIPWLGG